MTGNSLQNDKNFEIFLDLVDGVSRKTVYAFMNIEDIENEKDYIPHITQYQNIQKKARESIETKQEDLDKMIYTNEEGDIREEKKQEVIDALKALIKNEDFKKYCAQLKKDAFDLAKKFLEEYVVEYDETREVIEKLWETRVLTRIATLAEQVLTGLENEQYIANMKARETADAILAQK